MLSLRDPLARHTHYCSETWRVLAPHALVHRDDEALPDAPLSRDTLIVKKGQANAFELAFCDVTATIDASYAQVNYELRPRGVPIFPDAYYKARLFLPILRMIRGGIALHASAIERNGRATLFLAPSGVGKSTCAAAVLAFTPDSRMISDDTVVVSRVNDTFFVLPASKSFAMRHDLLSIYNDVFEREEGLSAVKSFLRVKASRVEEAAVPVERMVFLYRGASGALERQDAFSLMAKYFAQQFTLTHAPDAFRRVQFADASALLNAVSCFSLAIDFSTIDGMRRAVSSLL